MVNNSTNINKTNNHILLQLNEHTKYHGMMLQFQVNGEKMLGKTAGAIIMDNPEKLAT
jgi:hypothetical protein